MKKDNYMSGTDFSEDNTISTEDEKKGKLLISMSLWLNAMLLILNFILRFNQHVLFLVGGIVLMIGGALQHLGFKFLKNNALDNLPMWEMVFGAAMAVMSIVFIILT